MTTSSLAALLPALPKTDLHVHLDGSLRLPTLIELAREASVDLPSESEAGLRERVFKDFYRDLPEYLAGFRYTVAAMQSAEALTRVARELAEDNLAEGVRYLEVRFAPQLHIHPGLTMRQVVEAVAQGLAEAKEAFNRSDAVTSGQDIPFEFGIILCALRFFVPEMSVYYQELGRVMTYAPPARLLAAASLELAQAAVVLRDRHGLPVVGFDLAGAESGYPAVHHQQAFLHAHQNFLLKTVHAGEAYGAESIFQALTRCHANRIGHGTQLLEPDRIQDPSIGDRARYCEQLAEYMAGRRITVEVCLTSNRQTLPHLAGSEDHPVGRMIERGLPVSICTDNRLVSHTTVTREYEHLLAAVPLTRGQLRNLILAGFKGSFFPRPYQEKRDYVRRVIDRIEAVMGPEDIEHH